VTALIVAGCGGEGGIRERPVLFSNEQTLEVAALATPASPLAKSLRMRTTLLQPALFSRTGGPQVKPSWWR
jgi:hypothetical protein